MQEDWRVVTSFPRYRVSNTGIVQNAKTCRPLSPTFNQRGILKVNLLNEGYLHTRAVGILVAREFLPEPPRRDFTSVIHLNGDRENCYATNLAWRPRSFAVKYHQQFDMPIFHTSQREVVDLETGRVYPTVQEAAVEHGLLFSEIVVASHNRTFVWPTYQQFRLIEK